MINITKTLILISIVSSIGFARPISKPLTIFESTKIPRRTLADGPSIFGTLPFLKNESNMTKEDKKKYQKMVKEVKKKEKESEKYRKSPAMQVFESTKIHRDPSDGPSVVSQMLSKVFSSKE